MMDQQIMWRQTLIDTACQMGQSGINCGAAGNLSVRIEEDGKPGYLITPSGLDYPTLKPEDIVFRRERTPLRLLISTIRLVKLYLF